MRTPLAAGLVQLAFGMAGCSTGGSVATSSPMPSPAAPKPSPTSAPPNSNSLQLQGALATDSSREIVGSGRGCDFGPPLVCDTSAMILSNGDVVGVGVAVPAQASS